LSRGVSDPAPVATLTDPAPADEDASGGLAQSPWWEPGSQSSYHAVTQGYLVGEVVRQADARVALAAAGGVAKTLR